MKSLLLALALSSVSFAALAAPDCKRVQYLSCKNHERPATNVGVIGSTDKNVGSTGERGNNGHGNGDQDAPGNSGGHNNAENSNHSGQGNSAGGKGRGR